MQGVTRTGIIALTLGLLMALGAAPAAATTMTLDEDSQVESREARSTSDEGSAESNHCVMVEAWYRLLGGSQKYVLGPDHCVVGMPWSGGITVRPSAGEPSLVEVGVGVGVPLP